MNSKKNKKKKKRENKVCQGYNLLCIMESKEKIKGKVIE